MAASSTSIEEPEPSLLLEIDGLNILDLALMGHAAKQNISVDDPPQYVSRPPHE